MKILFLAHRIPYPPNKGDKIRSFNEIKYLSKRHEIHLVCLADDPLDIKYKDKLEEYCKTVDIVLIRPIPAKLKSLFYLFSAMPLSVPYFYSRKLQKIIFHLLLEIKFDVIFCFSSQMAEYVFKIKELRRSINGSQRDNLRQNIQSAKLVMDFVDVDSDKWLQYSKNSGFPFSQIYYLEGKRLAKYEQKITKEFTISIFVSENEVELFRKQNPVSANVISISNGVDAEYFNSADFRSLSEDGNGNIDVHLSSNKDKPIIVFTGAMDYFANIEGVAWFVKDVFPLIKKKIPDAVFYIVGSNPVKEIRELGTFNDVFVTGFVDDVRDYLSMATVCVAPLRIARGIQNKVLEAMAMGVPVVSSPQALSGLKNKLNPCFTGGDDPGMFAGRVVQVINSKDLQRTMSETGRDIVINEYNWDHNMKSLEKNILQVSTN